MTTKNKVVGHYQKREAKVPEAYSNWKNDPSDDNYHQLYTEIEPTIQSAIRTHGGNDPALRTRARILATQAFHSYDPKQGAALNTHVFNTLQRLNRVRAERSRAIHVPENMRTDRGKIELFISEHKDLYGREPSMDKMVDSTGLSSKRIQRALHANEVPVSRTAGDKGDLPAVRDSSAIWMDYVYHDLDERSKKIFEWTTGYQGAPTYAKMEIARKLGITPAAVSQRVARIASQLEQGISNS